MIISSYLLAVIVAWLGAQGLKYVFVGLQTRKFDKFRQLYLSGGMPSAHSAAVVALAVVVGLMDGVASSIFALTLLFAGIVMYDALMVRRSSGEQGVAIQKLIKEQKSSIALPRAAKGHTPMEVAAGAVLGAIIGLVVFLATK